MPSRARAALAVALLAVLAGCGGFTGSPATDAPTTPSPSTTTSPGTTATSTTTEAASTTSAPTTTPTMTADENLPPGVTEDGVADAQALAAAHAGLLRDQPYVANVSVVNRFSNGTLALERNRTVRYDDGEHVHDYRPRGPMTISQFDRRTIWGNDTVTLVRSEGPNGSVTYDRTSQSTGFGVPNYWQETVYGLVGAGGFTIETTFLSDPSKFRIASSDLVIAEAVDNATVSVLVDERGFVQEYRYEYDRKLRGDVPVHTVRTVEFSTVDGSTVSTPSWYDEAVNATADDPGGP